VGESYKAESLYALAQTYHVQAAEILRESLGPRHAYLVPTLAALAEARLLLGRYADAEKNCLEALVFAEKSLATGDQNVARCIELQARARLDDTCRRLADFSADIAHELRTPISNLLMHTQVALTKARDAEEYREILYSNLEEYQRLGTMIADMLFLAKADNGLIMPSREPVELRQEVENLFAYYEALAEDQAIGLTSRGEGQVFGDRLMLRRALSNLLSNAIRHPPRGGMVSVSIDRAPNGDVLVSVENPGEPIPAEQLSRIFDRFYRVDPSRQRTSEGAGLGLAITRSIVLSHGGQIRVSSAQTTRFEIQLPGLRATSNPAPR
jgi:two-component system heavy metal sensor histidine kinase CusS